MDIINGRSNFYSKVWPEPKKEYRCSRTALRNSGNTVWKMSSSWTYRPPQEEILQTLTANSGSGHNRPAIGLYRTDYLNRVLECHLWYFVPWFLGRILLDLCESTFTCLINSRIKPWSLRGGISWQTAHQDANNHRRYSRVWTLW